MIGSSVIQHQVDDNMNAAFMSFGGEDFEIFERAVIGMDVFVIRNIVFMIRRRRHNRHEPDSVYAQLLNVIELSRKPFQITLSVIVAVCKRQNKNFIPNTVRPRVFNSCFGTARCAGKNEENYNGKISHS